MGYAKPRLVDGNPSNQSFREAVTSPRHTVGTVGRLDDGRTFQYASSVSSSALVAGQFLMSEVLGGNYTNAAVAAAADVGATSVSVTLGGSETLAANAIEGGYLVVNDADGEGLTYRISGNPAVSSSTALTVNLDPSDSISVALTTSSEVCVLKSPTAQVVQAAAGHVHRVAGVAQFEVPAGDTDTQYFWIQTGGISAGWDDAATAIGSVLQSGTTAGQAEVGDGTAQVIGTQLATGVAGEYRPKDLSI